MDGPVSHSFVPLKTLMIKISSQLWQIWTLWPPKFYPGTSVMLQMQRVSKDEERGSSCPDNFNEAEKRWLHILLDLGRINKLESSCGTINGVADQGTDVHQAFCERDHKKVLVSKKMDDEVEIGPVSTGRVESE